MSDSSGVAGLTVGAAGEAAVLSEIFRTIRASAPDVSSDVILGPGDDAALLRVPGILAVTTDAMVEGIDFRLDWSTGYQLGWKLAATNLSDIAAMGARPVALTVVVCAPTATPVELLREVTRGLCDAATQLAPGCSLVGGDLSQGADLSFAVTALGSLERGTGVSRTGARAGDVVAYAGDLGLAGAGLRLLHAQCGDGCSPEQLATLWSSHPEEMRAHLQPSPPIALGPAAQQAGATAMMDVSDGLALDAARLGSASCVTLHLTTQLLPRSTELVSLDDILFGGEDHGLLATFPPDAALPAGFAIIGAVESRSAPVLVDGESLVPIGWDPFHAHRHSSS